MKKISLRIENFPEKFGGKEKSAYLCGVSVMYNTKKPTRNINITNQLPPMEAIITSFAVVLLVILIL